MEWKRLVKNAEKHRRFQEDEMREMNVYESCIGVTFEKRLVELSNEAPEVWRSMKESEKLQRKVEELKFHSSDQRYEDRVKAAKSRIHRLLKEKTADLLMTADTIDARPSRAWTTQNFSSASTVLEDGVDGKEIDSEGERGLKSEYEFTRHQEEISACAPLSSSRSEVTATQPKSYIKEDTEAEYGEIGKSPRQEYAKKDAKSLFEITAKRATISKKKKTGGFRFWRRRKSNDCADYHLLLCTSKIKSHACYL